METNDNKVAIQMLNDVGCILQAIEFNNPAGICFALTKLKEHVSTFDRIFHDNVIHERYGTYIPTH